MLDLEPLDYHEVNFIVEEKFPRDPERDMPLPLTDEEKAKVPKLRLLLKNAVLHNLFMHRKINKKTSLRTVL